MEESSKHLGEYCHHVGDHYTEKRRKMGRNSRKLGNLCCNMGKCCCCIDSQSFYEVGVCSRNLMIVTGVFIRFL